jgi:glycosyltransferase involved in cell wall biosynthesis
MSRAPEDRRLIYLSSFEYPSTHGHPLHALSMARAFSSLLGDRFLFVIGGGVRDASLASVPHASPFRERSSLLKVLHLRALGYAFWLMWFLARNREWRTNLIVFTNDLKIAAAARFVRALFRFELLVEVHGSAGRLVDGAALSAADRVFFVTEALRQRYETLYPHLSRRSTTLSNAVDAEAFARADGKKVRLTLGIPDTTTVIGYVGRFRPMESDKGIDFMLDALPSLPEDVCILLVGGLPDEIAVASGRAESLRVRARANLIPLIPFDERFSYFAAADILAYVPPKEDRFLREETSPMKLYEYMAAGKPIIVSELPAFREALGDDAYYIAPGSQEDFAQAVARIRNTPTEATTRAASGLRRANENTWERRAARVLSSFPS